MRKLFNIFAIFVGVILVGSAFLCAGCGDKVKKKTPRGETETTISDGSLKTEVKLKVFYNDSTRRFYTQTVKKGSTVTLKNCIVINLSYLDML